MHLVPVLHMLDGETVMSWCGRLARYHAGTTSHRWLETMQLSRQDVTNCTDYCVERLSRITGIAPQRIREGAYLQQGDRTFLYRSQHFGPHFAMKSWTTYCPSCLLEDGEQFSPSTGLRVGRVVWMFAPIRACPKHGIELVRVPNSLFSQQFQDMALVAPEDELLARQAADARHVKASPLQIYVEERFAGASGPSWLDGQRIDQAAKACEMLGACMEFGAHRSHDSLTVDEWIRAGTAGFKAAASGVAGIRQGLEQIFTRSRHTKSKGGPQAAFGRLYEWVQFKRSQQDRGPIREIFRDFILDTIAVDPGTNLFGERVGHRRLHSVRSLSLATGMHSKTLNRALVRAGLIPSGNENRVDDWACVDVEAEAFVSQIRNSLPIKKIPTYLNCNRTQAQALVRQGFLRQLCPGLGGRGGVLTGVPIEELDRFLIAFRALGQGVSSARSGMMDVIEASEIVRLPVVDIVRLVFAGKLETIELLPERLRFRSVLVDPDEVRANTTFLGNEFGLSQDEVAAQFGLISTQVNQLRKAVDGDGRPVLKGVPVPNARGTIRYRYPYEEICRFSKFYVKLGDHAKELGVSSRAMKRTLVERGIEPILAPKRLKAEYYRRTDL